MMGWGRKKPVSSSSSSSLGLSRAHHVSWFSKLSGSFDLKPSKEKKQDDEEASQNKSTKSSLRSTKRLNDIHESSKRFHRVSSVEKKNATTRSTEEIMRKTVKDFKRETCGFLEVEAMDRDKEAVIMTPRIQVNRDKQSCKRRDQRLLEQNPKRSEQDAEVLGHTVTKQWQNLKNIKVREVKPKAEQQRKSLYLRRELNRLGTKEYSKARVFSPRASEKCRVKSIEDLKKAKLRAQKHELVREAADGGMENESFAVVKCSNDPHKEFRDSMIEMIMENGINQPEELKELLVCYLRLNTDEYHDMIINAFQQVYNHLNFH